MIDPLLIPQASVNTVLLTNTLCRSRRSLGGRWRAILDPYDSGYINILGERNRQGFFRDFKPRSPSDRVEYDFDRSMVLDVPGDWNTQDPTVLYYEGTVWYRRLFDVEKPETPGRRTFLHFGAAHHTARVFLDGVELATHVGGFGPFSVEVTLALGVGSHSLVVQVNNRREANRIPAMRSDWWNFGGITRSVDLIEVPETFLRDAWVTMAPTVGSSAVRLSTDRPQRTPRLPSPFRKPASKSRSQTAVSRYRPLPQPGSNGGRPAHRSSIGSSGAA